MQNEPNTPSRPCEGNPGTPQLDTLHEHKLIRLTRVRELVPLSSSKLYELMQLGTFPRPIKISKQCVAWRLPEVLAWLEERRRERDSEESASR